MTTASTESPIPKTPWQRLAASRWIGTLFVFVLALTVRLVYLHEIRDSILFDSLIGDGRSFDAWAQRIVAGEDDAHGFYQAPFYPYFLASLYAVTGAHDTYVARLVQMVFGALSCVLVAEASSSFFSRRAGIIAGVLLSIYPLSIYFDGLIQKTSMAQFFGASLLFLLARRSGSTRVDLVVSGGLGVALGVLTLLRENSIVLAPVFLLWLWWGEPRSTRVMRCGLLLAGLVIALTPAAWRNYEANGVALPTSYNFGTNLFIGNHKGAPGYYTPLRLGRGDAEFERTDAHEVAERESGRALSPAEVSSFFAARAVSDIREDVTGWLRLLATKWVFVWNAFEISDTDTWRAYADESVVLTILATVFHFGVLCPLAALGMVATWGERRRLWVLYAMLAATAASVALFFVFGRYRMPLVLVLIPFASAGIAMASSLVAASVARRAAAVFALLVTTVFVNWPIRPIETDPRAVTYNSIGLIERGEGRVESSVALFTRALEIEPELWWARVNLANTLRGQGKFQESLPHYRRALEAKPDPVLGGEFALALLGLNQIERALPVLVQASEHAPQNVDFQNGLGVAYARRGERAKADRYFRRALELDPQNVEARRNLRRLRARHPGVPDTAED